MNRDSQCRVSIEQLKNSMVIFQFILACQRTFTKRAENTMMATTRLKILIILAGIFFLVHSSNLLACHESNFNGEELLVSTSFFGSHTVDNKMGKAVSVRENIEILTGNINQATTITSNYTIDTSQQLQTATGVLPISRSSSTTVSSKSQKRVPKGLDNI